MSSAKSQLLIVGYSVSNGTGYVCHDKISDPLTDTLISFSMIFIISFLVNTTLLITYQIIVSMENASIVIHLFISFYEEY